MNIGHVILTICILILFACAPTKVKMYPRETPPEKPILEKNVQLKTLPEKTMPEKTSSETISREKAFPEKTAPERMTSSKTGKVKPPSERLPTEKIRMMEPTPEKNYDETVSEWKSYEDVVKWMKNDFSFDEERYQKYEGTLPIPRTSEETFQLKSGIYIDAVFFLKETLYRINPSYNPRIVVLITRPYGFNHYVCSFETGKKLFIMDYGTPYREITGVHGPYSSLEEYKKFYEKYHPVKKKIEAITYLQ